MQTISQIQRDIPYQECTTSSQNVPIYLDTTSHPENPNISAHVPPSSTPNFQCHSVNSLQPCFDQTATGKTKWKNDTKRYTRPNQMQIISTPQMFFNGYTGASSYPDPRGNFISPHDTYYYASQQQQYYGGNYNAENMYSNACRPHLHRPYVTITQLNYQPIGYQQSAQCQSETSTNSIYGPPIKDRRNESITRFYSTDGAFQREMEQTVSSNKIDRILDRSKILLQTNSMNGRDDNTNTKKSDAMSETSGSFEYTIQPEQIVNDLCDDKDHETIGYKIQNDAVKSDNPYGIHPTIMTDFQFMDPIRIEDDELTKFIVDGCLKAEAIAVRNQHRPCFKNIKHLCARTRTDILKPRTTVANIHSQGIPWATKDFIFAFVRLVNSWFILKGYLEDQEGSLGKIDTAMTLEFKETYQRWQHENKEMVKYLINIFVNLDTGIIIQNAEIFSQFNKLVTSNSAPSNKSPSLDNPTNENQTNPTNFTSAPNKLPTDTLCYLNCQSNLDTEIVEEVKKNLKPESFVEEKLQYPNLDGRSTIPGILRVKEMFTNIPSNGNPSKKIEGNGSERDYLERKVYMKPGRYYVPKKQYSSAKCSSVSDDNETSSRLEQSDSATIVPESWETLAVSDFESSNLKNESINSQLSHDDIWKSALESIGPFIKTVMNETSQVNELQTTKKINEPIAKDFENFESKIEDKHFETTRNIETWVKGHCIENMMDKNIEKVTDCKRAPKSKKHGISNKSTGKKNIIATKIYKKKSEDRDSSCSKSSKYKGGSKNQHKNVCKKNELHQNDSGTWIAPKRKLSLSPISVSKFENIINALWNLQFAKYITFEVNAENIPDFYKYMNKPMFLYKVMNKLKQNKYMHPYQVVHDLRTIVRNSELYVEKRPDWWFEKCLLAFSKELESQLCEKFPSLDFNSVSGDPSEPPIFELSTSGKQSKEQNT